MIISELLNAKRIPSQLDALEDILVFTLNRGDTARAGQEIHIFDCNYTISQACIVLISAHKGVALVDFVELLRKRTPPCAYVALRNDLS